MSDINSPAPGTPQTGYKAYAVAAAAIIVVIVQAYLNDDDGKFTSNEFLSALVTAVIASGILGGTAFVVKNKAKRQV